MMSQDELLKKVQAMEQGDNILRELNVRALSEDTASAISAFTGIETMEVYVVIECLRHIDGIREILEDEAK